ncbi:hypothetical protein [Rhodopseudomonas pseudopalustris]|uniref:Uncharacterized protein n=1 Tax=Rhodopseudomonas pseudopalustris TaxID=1513892 RepID=A0A1H8V8F2_9BRAD|nr:hypothetical protein [Rhodopseudomonas pseudopalustris]SEP11705.1 hypothetical protein SAMN05444123_108122 [Rhodopseudomonas pseudopalustris]
MKHPHKGGSYRRDPDGSLTRLADEVAIATTPANEPPADTKPARKSRMEK